MNWMIDAEEDHGSLGRAGSFQPGNILAKTLVYNRFATSSSTTIIARESKKN